TLALEADARAVPDSGRDLDRVALRAPLAAGAAALRARLLDHRPVSATARARLREREQPLALRHDAAAVALRTDHRRRSRLRARAAALAARGRHLDGNLRLEPAKRILERHVDRHLDVRAALRLAALRSRAAAVEQPTEDVPEIAEVVDREVPSAAEVVIAG